MRAGSGEAPGGGAGGGALRGSATHSYIAPRASPIKAAAARGMDGWNASRSSAPG